MNDELYDEMARVERRFWWFAAKRGIVERLVDRYVTRNGAVPVLADIGCGTGGLLRQVRDRYDVIGLDSADKAVEYCEADGLTCRKCWLPETLPLDDASCDAIVMSDVLEHLEHDAASVKAVATKLKPGGVLVCTVPAHPWLWTARDDHHHHFRRYTKPGYDQIFENAGLKRELRSWYLSTLFPLLIADRVARKVLKRDEAGADIAIPHPFANRTLWSAFEFEKHLLGRVPIPAGASLISVHRRAV